MDVLYRQCHLRKGNTVQVAFLPESYAIKGRHVKLKDNGVWSNGWLVVDVAETPVGMAQLDNIRSSRMDRKDTLRNA